MDIAEWVVLIAMLLAVAAAVIGGTAHGQKKARLARLGHDDRDPRCDYFWGDRSGYDMEDARCLLCHPYQEWEVDRWFAEDVEKAQYESDLRELAMMDPLERELVRVYAAAREADQPLSGHISANRITADTIKSTHFQLLY